LTRAEQEAGGMVARDDLVARLDRAAARKVTIISAPAGSGKTSLLRDWANRPGRAHRIAFVSVRRDEPDAQLFWLALTDAVRRAGGTTGDTEPPTPTPDLNLRALTEGVLSELAGFSGRGMVVIDDLHELSSPDALAELALVRAGRDLARGRLDEAAAHLTVADTYAETVGRQIAGAACRWRSRR
jgi:LuxR family maltose regulon positive regulatory protein